MDYDVSNHPDNKDLHSLPKDSPADGTTINPVQATAGLVGAAAAGYVAGQVMAQRSARPGSGGLGGKTPFN